VVVAGGADRPSPVAQRHFIDYHAYGMLDMETPKRSGLSQRTTFGDVPIQQHRGGGAAMGGRGSPGCAPPTHIFLITNHILFIQFRFTDFKILIIWKYYMNNAYII
jgi:hypothetical protein